MVNSWKGRQGRGGVIVILKGRGVLAVPFGVKKGVLPLRMLSLKRSTAGASTPPFRVLSRKQMTYWR